MSYVNPDQLRELQRAASDALDAYKAGDKDKARDLLRPTSGFFFGSTEVDDWYAENLARTIRIIDKALKLEQVDFYYRSSW